MDNGASGEDVKERQEDGMGSTFRSGRMVTREIGKGRMRRK